MKEIAYVDMDGVLSDFDAGMKHAANEMGWTYTPSSQWSVASKLSKEGAKPRDRHVLVNRIVNARGFWLNLPMIDGAAEGISRLSQRFDVRIATTPWWSATFCVVEKLKWLSDHLDFGTDRVVFTQEKWLLRGNIHDTNILIDDKPENILNWPGIGIVFTQPWNTMGELAGREGQHRKGFWYRMDSWAQVGKLI